MIAFNPSVKINNNYNKSKSVEFGHRSSENDFLSNKQKMTILGASTVGMVAGLALSGRAQGLNIFRWKQFKKMKIECFEILSLAVGSIVGGLLAGIAVDKTNKKDKLRESLQQLVGNIIFPVSFVAGANYLYDKVEPMVKLPKFESKRLTAFVHSLPPIVAMAAGLGVGILVGNKFANSINNKIFKEKDNREIKITDFAAHVDDTLLGASLVAQNLAPASTAAHASSGVSAIGAAASKLIPPALVIPGYMTGTAQD